MDLLEEEIAAASAGFSGTVGVWGRRLPGGETVALRADESFETASAIKVLILAAALRRVREGRDALDAPLVYGPQHHVFGSGVLRELTPGLRLSLRDTLTLMIAVSDNVATNMVIDRVGGVDAVNAEAARQGMGRTRVLARLDFASGANTQGFGRSTPAELGGLFERLYHGRCVGAAEDRLMIDLLLRQQYNSALTRDLPYALITPPRLPGEQPALRLASKSGSWQGCRIDCGLFFGPNGDYILGLWSKDCRDARFHVDNEAMVLLPRISRLVWDRWGGGA